MKSMIHSQEMPHEVQSKLCKSGGRVSSTDSFANCCRLLL